MGEVLRRNELLERRLAPHVLHQRDLDDEVRGERTNQRSLLTRFPSGFDAPFHLSEECSNSNIASPRAIVLSSGMGGILGWFLQLVVAYTVIDIDDVLGSELGQPWASYLLQVMPQKTALAILALTIMCSFSMGQGCMVSLLSASLAPDKSEKPSLTSLSVVGCLLTSHVRVRPRRLPSILVLDQAGERLHQDSRQCRVV